MDSLRPVAAQTSHQFRMLRARIARPVLALALFSLVALAACRSDTILPTDPITNPSGPKNIGDLVTLNVNGLDGCSNPAYHVARVVAIGDKAMILNDTLNPPGFTTADFNRFAARFDTLVYPLDVANFGDPTDIDQNGHIAILFTRAVNELTPAHSTSYVGGFTFSRDLFPNDIDKPRAQRCMASNQGEYFYLLTPDPAGTINNNPRSAAFVDSVTTGVLAHEFEHLINAARRLYVNNANVFEERWLDEGLAHVAEELLFYHESGFTSRSNINISTIRSTTRSNDAYNADMNGNQGRYKAFLQAPSLSSPYAPDDSLSTRGGIWSLLRYAVDRVNATDGFTAGTGQSVTTSGDVALAAGTTSGVYVATVMNLLLAGGDTTTYTLTASPVSGASYVPQPEVAGPSPAAAAVAAVPADLRRDVAFESSLRTREREELTPLMGAARRWYVAQGARGPSAAQSRASFALSGFADADAAVWFKLVNSTTAGIPNLQANINSDLAGVVRDWNVSHAIDDVAALTTQYQQRSWNWHSIYPNLGSGGGVYPLAVLTLLPGTTVSGTPKVVSGGAAYYRITVPANGTVTLTLGPAASGHANLQMVVVRTQ